MVPDRFDSFIGIWSRENSSDGIGEEKGRFDKLIEIWQSMEKKSIRIVVMGGKALLFGDCEVYDEIMAAEGPDK